MPSPLIDRLRQGLVRIEQAPPGGADAEDIPALKRSLQRTIARLTPGNSPAPTTFRFQLTGGKALLFQGTEALPLDPGRVTKLLNAVGVELQAGESIDLDGALAASVIRPEMNLIDTNLRQAEVSLRGMKSGRDRDHVAYQIAESGKVRLRSRLTQLVSAIQAAQSGSKEVLPVLVSELTPPPAPPPPARPPPPPVVPIEPPISRIPPKNPDPGIPFPIMTTTTVQPEVLAKALRKLLAAVEGSGFKAAAIGEIAHQAWGSKTPAQRVELLIAFEGPQRETILGAARGEGLQAAPGGEPLHLQYTDAKLGGTAPVEIIQASSPFKKQVLGRAQPSAVFNVQVKVATCEDLILLRATSAEPGHRESVIELLRGTAGRLDGAYVKKEAEAAGVFDQLKAIWAQAKQQG